MTLASEFKPPTRRAIERVHQLLVTQYGTRLPEPRDPLDGLVLIILSQATSDVNCDRAFRELRKRFPTWQAVADAPLEDVASAIASGGLANQKAARIQQILRQIQTDSTEFNLNWMKNASADECRQYLGNFHGVGPKTVACVLLFFLGKPAFPVDTHVHRVTRRLGWIRAQASAEEAHRVLEKAIPAPLMLDFHINLITLGRGVCRAEGNGGPQCNVCPIWKQCLYGKTTRLKGKPDGNVPPDTFHGSDFFVTMQEKRP